MHSRLGQNFSMGFRSFTAISLFVLTGFAVSTLMGCGDVTTTSTTTSATAEGTSATGGGTSLDAIPVSEITWDGDQNPSTWTPVTKIDSIDIQNATSSAPTICWNWTQPASWPLKDGKSCGNNWIIVKINGVWHATPWEHLPKGDSVCRTTEALGGQPPFIQGYGPIASWYPKTGEEVGFMNSTIARGDRLPGTPYERTYVYKTTWQ